MVNRGLMKGKILSPAKAGFCFLIIKRDPRLESLGYSQASANANGHALPNGRATAPANAVGFTEPRRLGSGIKIQVEFRSCSLPLSVLTRADPVATARGSDKRSPFHVITLQKLFHLFAIVHHRSKQRLVVLLALEFQNIARAAGANQGFERLPFEHDDDQVHI
jgi:hypothetical protein